MSQQGDLVPVIATMVFGIIVQAMIGGLMLKIAARIVMKESVLFSTAVLAALLSALLSNVAAHGLMFLLAQGGPQDMTMTTILNLVLTFCIQAAVVAKMFRTTFVQGLLISLVAVLVMIALALAISFIFYGIAASM